MQIILALSQQQLPTVFALHTSTNITFSVSFPTALFGWGKIGLGFCLQLSASTCNWATWASGMQRALLTEIDSCLFKIPYTLTHTDTAGNICMGTGIDDCACSQARKHSEQHKSLFGPPFYCTFSYIWVKLATGLIMPISWTWAFSDKLLLEMNPNADNNLHGPHCSLLCSRTERERERSPLERMRVEDRGRRESNKW